MAGFPLSLGGGGNALKVGGDGQFAARAAEFYGSQPTGYDDSAEPVLWCSSAEPEFGSAHVWLRQHGGRESHWQAAEAASSDRTRLGLVAAVVMDVPSGYAGRVQHIVVDGRGLQWLQTEREVYLYLRQVVGEG